VLSAASNRRGRCGAGGVAGGGVDAANPAVDTGIDPVRWELSLYPLGAPRALVSMLACPPSPTGTKMTEDDETAVVARGTELAKALAWGDEAESTEPAPDHFEDGDADDLDDDFDDDDFGDDLDEDDPRRLVDVLRRDKIAWGCFGAALLLLFAVGLWWIAIRPASSFAPKPVTPWYETTTAHPASEANPPGGAEAAFVAAVRNARLSFDADPGSLVGEAQQLCQMLDSGIAPSDAIRTFKADNTFADDTSAHAFLTIAARYYCPNHLTQVEATG